MLKLTPTYILTTSLIKINKKHSAHILGKKVAKVFEAVELKFHSYKSTQWFL